MGKITKGQKVLSHPRKGRKGSPTAGPSTGPRRCTTRGLSQEENPHEGCPTQELPYARIEAVCGKNRGRTGAGALSGKLIHGGEFQRLSQIYPLLPSIEREAVVYLEGLVERSICSTHLPTKAPANSGEATSLPQLESLKYAKKLLGGSLREVNRHIARQRQGGRELTLEDHKTRTGKGNSKSDSGEARDAN